MNTEPPLRLYPKRWLQVFLVVVLGVTITCGVWLLLFEITQQHGPDQTPLHLFPLVIVAGIFLMLGSVLMLLLRRLWSRQPSLVVDATGLSIGGRTLPWAQVAAIIFVGYVGSAQSRIRINLNDPAAWFAEASVIERWANRLTGLNALFITSGAVDMPLQKLADQLQARLYASRKR